MEEFRMNSAESLGFTAEARRALQQRAAEAEKIEKSMEKPGAESVSKHISHVIIQFIFIAALIWAANNTDILLIKLPGFNGRADTSPAAYALCSAAILIAGFAAGKLARIYKGMQIGFYRQRARAVKNDIENSIAKIGDIAEWADGIISGKDNAQIKPQYAYDAEIKKLADVAGSYKNPNETLLKIIRIPVRIAAGVLFGGAAIYYFMPVMEDYLSSEIGMDLYTALILTLIIFALFLLIYTGVQVSRLKIYVAAIRGGVCVRAYNNLRFLTYIFLLAAVLAYPGYLNGWLDGGSPIDRLAALGDNKAPANPSGDATMAASAAAVDASGGSGEGGAAADAANGGLTADAVVPAGVSDEPLRAKKVVVIDVEEGDIFSSPNTGGNIIYTFPKGLEVELTEKRKTGGVEWGKISKAVDAAASGGDANKTDIVTGWIQFNKVAIHKVEDLSDFDQAEPSNFMASGELKTANTTYAAANAADGDVNTSWQVRSDGAGVGEWIMFEYNSPIKLDFIRIWPGNGRSGGGSNGDYFSKNARAKNVTLEFSGNQSVTYEFEDENAFQIIWLNKRISTSYIKMTIDDVYAGSQFHDLCISEIGAYYKR